MLPWGWHRSPGCHPGSNPAPRGREAPTCTQLAPAQGGWGWHLLLGQLLRALPCTDTGTKARPCSGARVGLQAQHTAQGVPWGRAAPSPPRRALGQGLQLQPRGQAEPMVWGPRC